MTDPTTTTGQPLLDSEDRDDLRRRWMVIEESFVDDPAAAVARADDLVDDVIDQIRATLSDRRTSLRGRWEALDDATTEQLRAALHHYEQLFTQLSAFSAPTGWDDDEPVGRPTTHGRPTFHQSGSTSASGDGGGSASSSGSTSVDATALDDTITPTDRSDSEKGARP